VFDTLIVQPIFNLLVLIYNLIPGHNFGLAIILFTILIRLLLWPLVKRQLHQTKLMRKLQPDIKRVKKAAKGDKAKEATMMMELYKEKGVSLFASFRIILFQLPILFGLYLGLSKVVKDPKQLVEFSYPWIQHFGWMQELAKDFSKFDDTLFGLVDLTRPAIGNEGLYVPAMLLVIGSAAVQYFQSVQLMPQDKDSRSLRAILKEAGAGKQADQSEVNAAVGRSTRFLLPALIFFFTVNLASALSLYWLTSGIVALIQQHIALREDVDEMEDIANKPDKSEKKISPVSIREKAVIEGEVIETAQSTRKKSTPSNSRNSKASRTSKAKKRRK
jgi:YidC/Oxa1 family membrane protein insertase